MLHYRIAGYFPEVQIFPNFPNGLTIREIYFGLVAALQGISPMLCNLARGRASTFPRKVAIAHCRDTPRNVAFNSRSFVHSTDCKRIVNIVSLSFTNKHLVYCQRPDVPACIHGDHEWKILYRHEDSIS